ncbi:hypothetical protein [Ammoniphilus sp. CFH 90114]|uniref:hypothetical protein n=1 Tax=Ammoniphilus sp. CFH 90114 TaxID=2493665 RepID=UPI00100D9D1C|nr:hypothetical protein [Ammoniphilus sp. CFH 90114]RXT07776.1 hypothetical protein EIZ39_10100 [Ammoniphilus sp. CFH 90114]
MNPWKEIFQGFDERIRNIAVFMPLFDLRQKQHEYPLFPIGIAIMLYILEDMLRGEKDCTYERVAYFLRDLLEGHYEKSISYEEALELAYKVIREGLMNQGKPQSMSYPDWESGGEKSYKFHLIELEDYQIKDKTVRLRLSTEGLELLFKTKEMYNELQVSITQLYLRQQIQKGVFDGALRSVEELALAVQNEKVMIRQLEEKIIRDVLQVAREQELQKQMARINEQLEREKKVFQELKELIRNTSVQYQFGNLTEKEEAAVGKIMRLERKLLDVISDHESLFTDKLRVQHLMNQSIESMILHAFNTRLNFDSEVLRPIVKGQAPLDLLKKVLDPILPMKRHVFFNPNRLFLEQPLRRALEEQPEEALWQVEEDMLRQEEERERELQEARETRLEDYFQLLLLPLVHAKEIGISEILSQLKQEEPKRYETLIRQLDFYPFIIGLHQMGWIPLLSSSEMDAFVLDDVPRVLMRLVDRHPAIHQMKGFELIATEQVIRLDNGYVMSDFKVRRRGEYGMGEG